ncbi:hypothetical protein [Iningainema tapete]|uniref:DUF4268 domain-containing protein n=1 Tax=Iningainema tapete BLCC-T55 TaxID=2748662 RepID=A0A8J6XRK5_9CYAN|nr:hypothetical protein [Iningainema tapete]MBD2777926.1 hypothetical protein [Iningainema tapete BLCC-T55]
MSAGIYLIQDDGQLLEMTEQAYDSEALLQELLAKYPNLLAGEQIDSVVPRRWLLISREIAVPDQEDSTGRWALDHLFLDQDGVSTLVEVKRSSDSRTRREVVGQMLDYAANAVVYWSIETIRAQFQINCQRLGIEPEQVLREFLGTDTDQEQFWQLVKTNLLAGKIRLVFVADKIPLELQRVVEFLNQQMNPAQVLALEIKQYVGEKQKTLVPRVISQTLKKPSISGEFKQWNESSFFLELETKYNSETVMVARQILQWTTDKKIEIQWGKGKTYGSFIGKISNQVGEKQKLLNVSTDGKVWCEAIFSHREKKINWLNHFPDVFDKSKSVNLSSWSIPLLALKDELVLKQFLVAMNWAVEQVQTIN